MKTWKRHRNNVTEIDVLPERHHRRRLPERRARLRPLATELLGQYVEVVAGVGVTAQLQKNGSNQMLFKLFSPSSGFMNERRNFS